MGKYLGVCTVIILLSAGQLVEASRVGWGRHAQRSAEHLAASCAQGDVTTAIGTARLGDTVQVPPGVCVWDGGTKLTVTKGVALRGAGMDRTVITWSSATTQNFIDIANQTGNVDITGFTFDSGGSTTSQGFIKIGGPYITRIYGNRFDMAGTDEDAIAFWGTGRGVVSGNVFHDVRRMTSLYGGSLGTTNWEFGWEWGSKDATYIEDNRAYKNFNSASIIGHHEGTRSVTRNNHLEGGGISHHGADSAFRAGGATEVYRNFMHGRGQDRAFVFRGGSSTIWGNIIDQYSFMGGPILYRSYGPPPAPASGNNSRCDGHQSIDLNQAVDTGAHDGGNAAAVLQDSTKEWGTVPIVYNDGGVLGSGTALDGFKIRNVTDGSEGTIASNTATTITATLAGGTNNHWNAGDAYELISGWPCKDQPGLMPSLNDVFGTYQRHVGVYQWDNRFRATSSETWETDRNLGINNSHPMHVDVGRELFNHIERPNYRPYIYPHPLREERTRNMVQRASVGVETAAIIW
jgi:hypothetical protein